MKKCQTLEILKIGVNSIVAWNDLACANFVDTSTLKALNTNLFHCEINGWVIRQEPRQSEPGVRIAASGAGTPPREVWRTLSRRALSNRTRGLVRNHHRTFGVYSVSCLNGRILLDRDIRLGESQVIHWLEYGLLPTAAVSD